MILLIYFLGTSRSLAVRDGVRVYHYSWFHSMEDVVGLTCGRAGVLSVAYALGMRQMHRWVPGSRAGWVQKGFISLRQSACLGPVRVLGPT